jgi:ribosomal protein S6-L-glutamate ligase RimK-like protein
VILLCGIPSESPLAMVTAELERLRTPHIVFNQRRFAETTLEWELGGGQPTGRLRIDGHGCRLEDVWGVYTRMMDDSRLPELEREPPASRARLRSRALHDTLYQWQEVTPARVVNRPSVQGSNASKPYQAQLIAGAGLHVPETLITNQPDLVREFQQQHGRVVYKSMSGVRSIVKLLDDDDLRRLERIRACPVQFQAFVGGTDVRVHVVGDRVFATEIASRATDYRYGGDAELRPRTLPDDLTETCVRLAAKLELPFAGIDLRVAGDGRVFCFEVNPSPAFSYYESHTRQPIARAVARYLCGC